MSADTQESQAVVAPPACKLYTVAAVVIASLFGSFLAAGVVLALNFRRLGRSGAARTWLLLCAVATALVVALALALPDNVPGSLVYMPSLLVIWAIAKNLLTKPLAEHVAAGGQLASNWGAVLVGVVCLVVIMVPVVVYAFLSPVFPGETIDVEGNDVYHSGGATATEARRLAALLLDEGYMEADDQATVHLEKTADGYALDLVVTDGAWDDAAFRGWTRDLAKKLVESGFGPQLAVRLLDELGDVHATITAP